MITYKSIDKLRNFLSCLEVRDQESYKQIGTSFRRNFQNLCGPKIFGHPAASETYCKLGIVMKFW